MKTESFFGMYRKYRNYFTVTLPQRYRYTEEIGMGDKLDGVIRQVR